MSVLWFGRDDVSKTSRTRGISHATREAIARVSPTGPSRYRVLAGRAGVTAAGAFLALAPLNAAMAQTTTAIAITNSSFETPTTSGTTTVIPGWSKDGASADFEYNVYQTSGGGKFYAGANASTDPSKGGKGLAGVDGENLAFVVNSAAGSGYVQTLTSTFAANTAYTLTVSVGNRDGGNAATYNGAFAGSMIELLAGDTVIAVSTDTNGPAEGSFYDQSVTLDALNNYSSLVGQALTIKLLTTNFVSHTNNATDWDNVRLNATSGGPPMPEPGSVALVAPGLFCGGVLVRRRLRRG